MDTETLVLLDTTAVAETLRSLREHGDVRHVLAPRLAVVAGDGADVAEVDGVAALLRDHVPDDVRVTLTATERTFVDAWLARRRPRERRGDGLSWDAPGFLPPDPPRR